MRKIYSLILLLGLQILYGQSFNWDIALSQIYTPVSGTSPKKVLLDKAPIFADLYNFNYPEYNTSNSDHFQQALTELNMASNNIFTNQNSFPDFIQICNTANEIPIGILSVKSSYLNYDEEDNSNGNLQLINNVFHPINSSVPNFIEKDLLVISPLFPAFSSLSNSYNFKIDASQFYQYINNVKKLDADFGDGVWRNLITDYLIQPSVSVNIPTSGVQKQKISFRTTLENGSQITTYSEILLSKKTDSVLLSKKTESCSISSLLKHRSTIADAVGVKGEIEYKIWYGNQNSTCNIRKPIIIVDGFDPGDKRRIDYNDCYEDDRCKYEGMKIETYGSLSKLMEYSEGSLIDKLNEKNFDVILVNLPYYNKIQNNPNSEVICAGADDIVRNAYTVASFIQKINSDLQTVSSSEKLVVVGPSMGGLITRYALAYLEKQGINHNTKVWVSMDSPHQGANIPLAIQEDIWFFAKMLKQNSADEQFTKTLHSPAAEQMLIDIVKNDGFPYKNQNNTTFLAYVKNNGVAGSDGFPVSYGIKNIAITNGSLSGVKNVNPKENFLHIKASAKIRLLGIRVGRKRIFRVNNYYMSNQGESLLLVQNQGRNPDKNVSNIDYTTTIISAWDSNGSMDAVPGGNTNSANDLKEQVNASLEGTNAFSFPISFGNWFILPALTTDKNLIIDRVIPSTKEAIIIPQTFIPMHSALDTSGFSDWYQPITKNISCSGQTRFDSFYGENFNMEHVSFTPNMVNWLLKSITEGIQDPYFPIESTQFNGSNIICENSTSTYSFPDPCKLPSTPTWSLSNTNAQIISSTASSVTLQGISNGLVILTATFQNGQTFTKKIWIGKPFFDVTQIDDPTYYNESHFYLDGGVNHPIESQGITNIKWTKVSANPSHVRLFAMQNNPEAWAMGDNNSWTMDIKVEATNACGTTEFFTTIMPPPALPCEIYNLVKDGETSNSYSVLRVIEPPCLSNKTVTSRQGDQYQITVANSLGIIVILKTGDTFDLSSFPTGMYVVNIQKDNQVIINQTLIKH
ncbi:T9SS type A sorting domain-containing protein [Chryseobacterium gotjawalense]|uniref:T9SS type A sorting domain-containing protein n=1 Tax=Chryseobacterium gotjawalense TaxID=3042315 RepID=A0ABY8RA17_9FLAO|nr:T9SS type A sorting domain-containing protein [Chryseobacterium sp. wdc7]WHF50803.1 T9SS type A sorting domain-containing protein [Chryseobacterium sp. wdc7]